MAKQTNVMGDGWLNRQSPSRLSKLDAKIAPCTFAYIISFKFPTQNASNPISEYRAVLAVNIISMKMIILPISTPLSKLMTYWYPGSGVVLDCISIPDICPLSYSNSVIFFLCISGEYERIREGGR